MADTTEKPHGAPNTVDRVYRWMRPHSRRGRSAPVAQDGSAEDGGFFFFFSLFITRMSRRWRCGDRYLEWPARIRSVEVQRVYIYIVAHVCGECLRYFRERHGSAASATAAGWRESASDGPPSGGWCARWIG